MKISRSIAVVLLGICMAGPGTALSIDWGVGGGYELSYQIWQGNWAYVDTLIAYMDEADVRSTRVRFSCQTYLDYVIRNENSEIAIGYIANFQTFLDKCSLANIDVTLLLGYGSTKDYKNLYELTGCSVSAPDLGIRSSFPPEDEAWRLYVDGMMANFGSKVTGVEVWNEPDHIEDFFYGRVGDYITLFNIAVVEIKDQFPDMPVSTGGLACREPVYRSYLEALLNENTGVYNSCDAVGIHLYNGTAIERLRIYRDVCAELGVAPKPVWVTEFGRTLDESPDKFNSLEGARAYPEHMMEVFSSYGVERAMWYCVTCPGGGVGGYNLFEWNEATGVFSSTELWDIYSAAIAKFKNFDLGDTIGFGDSGGEDLFGISPYEDYSSSSGLPGYPVENQSTFEFLDGKDEYPLGSKTINGYVLPISFDLNDSWLDSISTEVLILEVDVYCDGGQVQLRHQSCCETTFVTKNLDTSQFDNLFCSNLIDGLTVRSSAPDYSKGVPYSENTVAENLSVQPGVVTTVFVAMDDWMFQNGMERRADISFVPVNNQPFEIHRVVIYPAEAPGVEYADKSSETQMAYTGQPRNAMSMDFDGNDSKDLVMTRFDDFGLAYTAGDAGLGGVPQFTDVAPEYFPSSAPSVGASGIISADFDNDGWVDFFAPNFTSGGRLFRNIQGTHYEDWTSESGLENPLWEECISEALTCSWGDYDGDGYLDLAVVAGDMVWQTDGGYRLVVLHNKGGVFDFAVIDTGEFVGNSPLWADFDNDGDLDLAIIKTVSSPLCCDIVGKNYFFNNQGDGSFVEDIYALLGEENYGVGGRVATVADYDNDGDLDIIYADESGVFVMENAPILTPDVTMELGVFVRSLKTYFDLPHGDYVGPPLDVSVMDFNLDGYQDVIVGYGDASSSQGPTRVYLLENRVGADSYRGLVDVSADVGLSGDDKFAGLAIADFNRDGFSDLYLTRKATDSFFYKAKEAFGRRQKSWVGIRLNSPHGTNNTQGLGATVVLTAGSSIQTQVVDGGSGFSSQHEAELLFGLDDYGGGVTVQVSWPSGHVQNLTAVSINQYLTITDDSPVIDNTTIQVSKVFHVATGLEDWVFTWETFNTSNTYRDEIGFNLSGVSAQCLPEHSVLRAGIGGVTVSIVPVGGGKFKHTLTYPDVECRARCTIPFTITSAVVDCISTSEERSVRTSSCLLGK